MIDKQGFIEAHTRLMKSWKKGTLYFSCPLCEVSREATPKPAKYSERCACCTQGSKDDGRTDPCTDMVTYNGSCGEMVDPIRAEYHRRVIALLESIDDMSIQDIQAKTWQIDREVYEESQCQS